MSQNESKLKRFEEKLFRKCLKYAETNSEMNNMSLNVIFFGFLLYPNVPSILNFDILYLYKAFQRRHIEARIAELRLRIRIHDPHIQHTEAASYGITLGRQNEDDKLSHFYDVIILSTPHNFYLRNLHKLTHLFKSNKKCLWLDIYGYVSPITLVGCHNIDVIDFFEEAMEAELMGIPRTPPNRQIDWKLPS